MTSDYNIKRTEYLILRRLAPCVPLARTCCASTSSPCRHPPALQVPEAVCQVLVVVTSMAGRHWFAAVLNTVVLVFVARRFLKGKAYLEPLELWKQLKDAQKTTHWKIGSYIFLFALSMYRYVPSRTCWKHRGA